MAQLAKSLRNLRSEVNARWPKRDKRSDGWIGDRSHRNRASDHNPDARGWVHAIDIDASGVVPSVVIRAAINHPSTNYVIYNRVIYSRRFGFKPRRYRGANPHKTHIHVSISRTTVARSNPRKWLSGVKPVAKPARRPAARPKINMRNVVSGKRNADVKAFQVKLRAWLAANKANVARLNPSGATGLYGRETAAMVRQAYIILARRQRSPQWLKQSLTRPPASLATNIGFRTK
jgi:hypothetical protein